MVAGKCGSLLLTLAGALVCAGPVRCHYWGDGRGSTGAPSRQRIWLCGLGKCLGRHHSRR